MKILLLVLVVSGPGLALAGSPSLPGEREGGGLAPSGRIVAQLGKREVILESGRYGLKYFPDGCLAFVRFSPDYRILVAAGVSSWLLQGPGMKSLVSRGKVLEPGKPGSFDNGYAGIGGIARDPATGKVLAFYHAEDQEEMPRLPSGIPGFYCSVGLAVSENDGATFRKLGPVIRGSLPKDSQGRGDQGCGEAGVVADKEGRYLLAYYSDHSRVDGSGVQICLARCPIEDALRTDRWRKYYRGAFDEPGLGGKKPSRSGVYAAYSRDGIHWSTPTQLISIRSIAAIGEEVGWHPTLLVSTLEGDCAKGWLFYSYSESWGHTIPHWLLDETVSASL
jgi:hypothetical protein